MKRILLLIVLTLTLGMTSSGSIQYTFDASDPGKAADLAREFLKSQGFIEISETNGLKEFKNVSYHAFAYFSYSNSSIYLGFTGFRSGCSSAEGFPYIEREYIKYQKLLESNDIKVSNFVIRKSANELINYAPVWPEGQASDSASGH